MVWVFPECCYCLFSFEVGNVCGTNVFFLITRSFFFQWQFIALLILIRFGTRTGSSKFSVCHSIFHFSLTRQPIKGVQGTFKLMGIKIFDITQKSASRISAPVYSITATGFNGTRIRSCAKVIYAIRSSKHKHTHFTSERSLIYSLLALLRTPVFSFRFEVRHLFTTGDHCHR